ncbi:AAA family ATPase [Sporosarcina sp. PTS2304]|uniref:AAA family ATPase n=1 Tax=Sporosarcina sp. PTS2304 TaxID=2283194 RepID=UPI0013B37F91|nr:AAA family ATPase [Sporosarcina sp. PTS2304]
MSLHILKKEQIVTVILGENGREKTGIYRAVLFALFGDAKLQQDSNEADIYLGNIKAVKEMSKEANGARCSFTLSYSHQGEDYTITRTYFSILEKSGSQKERMLDVLLTNETT